MMIDWCALKIVKQLGSTKLRVIQVVLNAADDAEFKYPASPHSLYSMPASPHYLYSSQPSLSMLHATHFSVFQGHPAGFVAGCGIWLFYEGEGERAKAARRRQLVGCA